MNTLRNQIQKIEQKFEKELKKEKINKINECLGLELIDIINECKNLSEDMSYKLFLMIESKKSIIHIHIDKYNNCRLYFPIPKIPIDIIEKIRQLLNEYLEHEQGYFHRSGTGFIISYYKEMKSQLTMSEIVQLCKLDDNNCEHEKEGFRNWVLGENFYKKYMPLKSIRHFYDSYGDSYLQKHPDFKPELFILKENENQ